VTSVPPPLSEGVTVNSAKYPVLSAGIVAIAVQVTEPSESVVPGFGTASVFVDPVVPAVVQRSSLPPAPVMFACGTTMSPTTYAVVRGPDTLDDRGAAGGAAVVRQPPRSRPSVRRFSR
jgi:hypothetical protein